jgi:hypothetical protein
MTKIFEDNLTEEDCESLSKMYADSRCDGRFLSHDEVEGVRAYSFKLGQQSRDIRDTSKYSTEKHLIDSLMAENDFLKQQISERDCKIANLQGKTDRIPAETQETLLVKLNYDRSKIKALATENYQLKKNLAYIHREISRSVNSGFSGTAYFLQGEAKRVRRMLAVNTSLIKELNTKIRKFKIQTYELDQGKNMNKQKQIITKFESAVSADGYVRKNITAKIQYGMGNAKSYFDVLVDTRLAGNEYPTAQEAWEELKGQINFLTSNLLAASEEYSRLATKNRGLTSDHIDLIKENKSTDSSLNPLSNITKINDSIFLYKTDAVEINGYGEDDVLIGFYSTKEIAKESFNAYAKAYNSKWAASTASEGSDHEPAFEDRYSCCVTEYRLHTDIDDFNF